MGWSGEVMSEALISDLVLTDEHATVGVDDSVVEGTKRLIDLPGGVLIVLGEDDSVKGVLGTKQILSAVAKGRDLSSSTCGEYMELDVMQVKMDEKISDVLPVINERKPQAVVAVDEDGAFSGYFSPNDYRQAMSKIDNMPAIRALE
jgi:predicted transcriptional regulator